ncbi:DUF4232 domain-containing protein [Streptomyces sp. NPDC059785]|uniref:DUF4232 domain-containing protein n=1 Tax=Streptomyces sp. NPDC059785 TaxID=3346945 RepID=UPI003653055B
MSARTARTRLLAAATLAVAAFTMTACDNGEGVRDEGASAQASETASGTTGTTGGSDSTGSKGTGGSKGTNGSKGAEADQASSSSGSSSSSSRLNPCTTSVTKVTATEVSRPLNHMLLTVTNTGSKTCHLVGYPAVRFGEAQSVPPVFEESQPQAVVTLAPGESGYAGVRLSMADGSGKNGYTAESLTVYFNDDKGTATPSLPAKGTYVDDSLTVTYWQQDLDDALMY